MKWVFAAMVAVNVGFALWASAREPPVSESADTPVASVPGSVNRLLLLGELEDGSLRERGSAPVTEETAPPAGDGDDTAGAAGLCFSVGPLSNQEDVERVGAWLGARGGVSTLREGERREVSRFWVYFPPFQSRDAAISRVQEMREAQIDDIYVIPRGDMANAVSLGLYSHRDSLERRMDELRSKGYEPSVERRYEARKSSWYDVLFPAGVTFPKEHFVAEFPEVEAAETACT